MVGVDIESHIDSPPDDVFERLKDIDRYRTWLPRSIVYLDSRSTGEDIGIDTVFWDETRIGTLRGRVTAFDPPWRIAFTQRLEMNGTVVFESRPAYRLEARHGGTVVHHSGEAELSGPLKVAQPLLWLFAQYERRRVVRALKRSSERR